jgi:hypothetical protein
VLFLSKHMIKDVTSVFAQGGKIPRAFDVTGLEICVTNAPAFEFQLRDAFFVSPVMDFKTAHQHVRGVHCPSRCSISFICAQDFQAWVDALTRASSLSCNRTAFGPNRVLDQANADDKRDREERFPISEQEEKFAIEDTQEQLRSNSQQSAIEYAVGLSPRTHFAWSRHPKTPAAPSLDQTLCENGCEVVHRGHKHPAIQWEERSQELHEVLRYAKLQHAEVKEGEVWCVIDYRCDKRKKCNTKSSGQRVTGGSSIG